MIKVAASKTKAKRAFMIGFISSGIESAAECYERGPAGLVRRAETAARIALVRAFFKDNLMIDLCCATLQNPRAECPFFPRPASRMRKNCGSRRLVQILGYSADPRQVADRRQRGQQPADRRAALRA